MSTPIASHASRADAHAIATISARQLSAAPFTIVVPAPDGSTAGDRNASDYFDAALFLANSVRLQLLLCKEQATCNKQLLCVVAARFGLLHTCKNGTGYG